MNTEKLISVEVAEQAIVRALVDCMIKHKGLYETSDAVLDALHSIPAVDAVSVVQCRKCIHSEEVGVLPEGVLYCNTNDMPIPENGYCHRWKRKENAE